MVWTRVGSLRTLNSSAMRAASSGPPIGLELFSTATERAFHWARISLASADAIPSLHMDEIASRPRARTHHEHISLIGTRCRDSSVLRRRSHGACPCAHGAAGAV